MKSGFHLFDVLHEIRIKSSEMNGWARSGSSACHRWAISGQRYGGCHVIKSSIDEVTGTHPQEGAGPAHVRRPCALGQRRGTYWQSTIVRLWQEVSCLNSKTVSRCFSATTIKQAIHLPYWITQGAISCEHAHGHAHGTRANGRLA